MLGSGHMMNRKRRPRSAASQLRQSSAKYQVGECRCRTSEKPSRFNRLPATARLGPRPPPLAEHCASSFRIAVARTMTYVSRSSWWTSCARPATRSSSTSIFELERIGRRKSPVTSNGATTSSSCCPRTRSTPRWCRVRFDSPASIVETTARLIYFRFGSVTRARSITS